MATISSLGIGSGLDLSSIVEGLVDAERQPTENRLDTKQEDISIKLSGFGALKSSLSLFQGTLSDLKLESTFNGNSASVSDSSILSVFASSVAQEGSYSVEVSKLAKAHSLATNELTPFENIDDTIGSGTLSIQLGTTSTGPYSFTADNSKAVQNITVSADNNNTTLSGLRDYINNGDYGITAAIVNDGNGFRLTLTSEQTGAANSMQITVTDDDGDPEDNLGLSQLAFNADAQLSMGQTVQAQDAELSINGLDITRETNTVTGAINGVTLTLLKEDIGNTINVNIATDTSEAKSSIQEFVDGYNGLVNTINTLTAYDAENNSGGILIGDFTVRSMASQLRSLLTTTVSQLGSEYNSLTDIGIFTNDDGSLSINSDTLDQALANAPEDVASLFATQGRSSDDGVNYISSSSNTVVGTYAVNIDSMATRGLYTGANVVNSNIGSSNDEFSIRVDNTLSGTITLAINTYTGSELAAHIQAQINNDETLKAAGKTVNVAFNAGKLEITSNSYGSDSGVDIVTVDSNMEATIGLSVKDGTDGSDIVGTINGRSANGDGQLLTSTSGASEGLELSIGSGAAGNRGSITLTRGIASALDELLASFVSDDGLISSREEGFNDELDQITEQREALETRISSLEARLVQQFSALDSLIARFNTTSQFLSQQLANLPEANSISRNRR